MWTVPREWSGETCFIVAGGPSVAAENLDVLRGRNVIAVNSSFAAAPFAQYLFAGDARWLRENDKTGLSTFAGRVVTCAHGWAVPWHYVLRKVSPPPGIARDPSTIVLGRSSTHGALNLAAHLGAKRIVLLGADMRRADDGRSHHHAPHPWPQKPGCWDEQMEFLKLTVPCFEELGVEVLNASPVSRIPWWPKVRLADVV